MKGAEERARGGVGEQPQPRRGSHVMDNCHGRRHCPAAATTASAVAAAGQAVGQATAVTTKWKAATLV